VSLKTDNNHQQYDKQCNKYATLPAYDGWFIMTNQRKRFKEQRL